jgi:uncharacterized membrane protein YqhA
MFSRLLTQTRYIVLAPVVGATLASLLALGFGIYELVSSFMIIISGAVEPDNIVKLTVINLMESIDLFLIGTAFYLISLGLYELFIDEKLVLPGWLEIHDLDDLKTKLINVIVVVLGVQFLAQVLNWKGDNSLLPYGTAIAIVILALAFFIGQKNKGKSHHSGNLD